MNAYERGKERARDLAVDFSNNVEQLTAGKSWSEVAAIQNKFQALGRRYGLLKEFRENGIC